MGLQDLDIKTITLIQIGIAAIISLIFQLLIPLWWQPLDYITYGRKVNHGDPGMNYTFFTMSQWYFSLSIAWFIYRDNLYINNFLVYALIPLSMIAVFEFAYLFLYHDYIHVFPCIIGAYILFKKRDTLEQRLTPHYIALVSFWLWAVYFLKLAYYEAPVLEYFIRYLVNIGLGIALSFCFRKKSKI